MKKLYLLLVVASLTLAIVTGCSSNGGNNEGTNTSTGTNDQSGNNSTQQGEATSNLAQNVSSSGAITKEGKLIVFIKNNNNTAVDLDIEVEFYDADGMIAGSDSDILMGVGANNEVAVEMYGTPEEFDNYKIYVDVEATSVISYLDKVELVHNNNGEEIVAQVKNNSQDEIDYIEVSVVYYQDDKVVGYDYSNDIEIKAERSANFTLRYPHDDNYDDVKFDTYKVFINEAYSYNW